MPSSSNTTDAHAVTAALLRNSVISSIRSSPIVVAALLTAVVFGLLLFAFRPGYWINDDVKIVWSIAGYPGGTGAQPFLVYSNVLLGLALAPLYALSTGANWLVLLLVLLNAFATGSLLWLIVAAKRHILATIAGCAAILIGVAALTINITFTMTSCLAAVAGFSMLWFSSRRAEENWQIPAAAGCMLLLAGAMLRLPMLLISLLMAVPVVAGSWNALSTRRLLGLCAAAGLLILAAVGLDRLYVRASPDWNAFYAYTRVRQQLHDSHRLNNVHTEIRRVGWTPNDQELFAHWFYPDEQLYSLEKLQYLVDRVPPESQDAWGSAVRFGGQLGRTLHVPYLLWMVAIVAGALVVDVGRRDLSVVLFTWAVALGVNLVLAVIYKDPDYVLAGSLAGSLAFSLVYLWTAGPRRANRRFSPRVRSPVSTFLIQLSFVLTVLGGVALLANLFAASSVNIARQQDYARFRSDLEALQREGVLAGDALIVSPAHGLPYEWAYPLTVDLPSPPYLDTGWITFSPAYDRVLREYGITSLPEALVSRDNVYLMAEASFTSFLSRYYEERLGYAVSLVSLYEMRPSVHLLSNDPVHLFQLSGVR